MCRILIHKKEHQPLFGISHGGIKDTKIEVEDFILKHSSLPLQTHEKKNLEQPIKLKNGGYLLYNGEIFNTRKISKFDNDLEYLKDLFNKTTDLKKIQKEVNKFDGFWAIVLYLPTEIIAFCDTLGKKQLYYSDKGICSEIKPLIENGRDFLYTQHQENTTGTMFPYIKRLTPNVFYTFKKDLISYSPFKNIYDLRQKTELTLLEAMDEAVENRMINTLDGITVLISGGLDSTIILYHLLKKYPKDQFQFLTIDNQEDQEHVKIVEEYFDIECDRIKYNMTEEDKYEMILAYEHSLDYGSLPAQYLLSKHSKNSVIITGDGADELFSGYSRALKTDTFKYDVYTELPYFHHLRLDRIGMKFTKEIRSPFLSKDMIEFATHLPYPKRIGKKILKETYKGLIPDEIINRKKIPLRKDNSKQKNIDSTKSLFVQAFKRYEKKI